MKITSSVFAVVGGLFLASGFSSPAQIALDGSFGKSGPLTGPNYSLTADLGQRLGPNLFHSFSQFNLVKGETATFSGPSDVQNILSRVTGGSASSIDGTLRSTISGANFYLVNPAGVMFGPNASVDVGGSFGASTADYAKLGNGGRFNAKTPEGSVLTSAPIEAFGFLGPKVAGIKIEESKLSVSEGKTITVVGAAASDNLFHPFPYDLAAGYAIARREKYAASRTQKYAGERIQLR